MKIKIYDEYYETKIEKTTYETNENLAICLMCYDKEIDFWGFYTTLTVNFNEKLPENYAYVDTNNIPNAEQFIEENKLGEFVGKYKMSGFCCYPLYKFY